MIDGLHGEVEGHELAHRTQTGEGSADGNTGETHLGDGRIDYPLVAVLFPQTSGHLLKECVEKFNELVVCTLKILLNDKLHFMNIMKYDAVYELENN